MADRPLFTDPASLQRIRDAAAAFQLVGRVMADAVEAMVKHVVPALVKLGERLGEPGQAKR